MKVFECKLCLIAFFTIVTYHLVEIVQIFDPSNTPLLSSEQKQKLTDMAFVLELKRYLS